jgi:pilus assembly protein CpaB
MKPKTMILLVVAIACGLGASYMTSRLLAERGGGEAEQPKVAVLVASKNLDMGLTLKNPQDLFTEKQYPAGDQPSNAINDPIQLKGKILKRSLRAGDWVSADDLLNDKDSLAAFLPEGYRAVGLRMNIADIAGGFASLPHSRVDIISTVRRGSDKDSYSQVLLENVLVLAADQTTQRMDAQAMPANVVTVALKPEDALKVTLAKELGPLSLVLRRFSDNKRSDGGLKVTVDNIVANQTANPAEVTDDSGPSPANAVSSKQITDLKIPSQPKFEATKQVAKANQPPTPAPEPEVIGTLHRIRIFEGDRERTVEFLLNDDGDVIDPEVTRTELTPQGRGSRAPRPQGTPAPRSPEGEP